tara:strand:- start:102 stop:488 length:387 start_codon:yes stop_codon:yes gene_type:complete
MPYSGTPEERKEKARLYNLKNKEKVRIRNKNWREKNREILKVKKRKYQQSPAGKKSNRISKWKSSGVIHNDFNELYEKYITTELCELCSCVLTVDKINTSTTRCLDHCHETGQFRNVLCMNCNINVVR